MKRENITYHAKGVPLKVMGWIISVVAFIISGLLIFSLFSLSYTYQEVTSSTQNYMDVKDVAGEVQSASDYLTEQVRLFVINGKEKYMGNYFSEAKEKKTRENALEKIHENLKDSPMHETVHLAINNAVNESMKLMDLEFYAFKLICEDQGISYASYPDVANADISAIAPENRVLEATKAVFGDEYIRSKEVINTNVNQAITALDGLLEQNVLQSTSDLKKILIFQTSLIVINIIFIGSLIILMHVYIINPMNTTIKALLNNEKVDIHSNREFNYMAETYNHIREQNEHIKEKLVYEAEHDKLTGLYNRTGYDTLYRRMRLEKTIYVLLDIDKFKDYNDTLGHEVGDKVLVRTANVLNRFFNDENSFVFRLGGDEFAVLIENIPMDKVDEIAATCVEMNKELAKKQRAFPGITLSIGIACGEENDTTDTLFKKADIALYRSKHNGKGHICIYCEDE